MKKIITICFSTLSIFFFASPAFAHVIVRPNQVGVAQTQVFTMSVPNEKDTATTSLRLIIPEGLQQVVPNVTPGWTVNILKKGDAVVEIDWTGGSIPPEQREEFLFEAQAPGRPGVLKWKAYQTFQDGTIIAWDHTPTANPEDDAAPPPYSQTNVINDLAGSGTNSVSLKQSARASDSYQTLPIQLSLVAIALAAVSIVMSLRKKS